MNRRGPLSKRLLLVSRLTPVALLAGLAAGCSATPFYTGAVQPTPPAAVGNSAVATPAPVIQSAPIQSAALPAATSTPSGYTPSAAVPASAAPAAQSMVVTAQSGDTLYSLSRQHNVSVGALAAANGLTINDGLRIGQQITIPGGSAIATTTASAATTTLGAPPSPLGTVPADPTATATASIGAAGSGPQTHTVSNGETIYSIAVAYGVSPTALAQANNMSQPELVQVGQQLAIPAGARTPAAAQASAPAAEMATTTAPAASPPAETAVPVQVAAADVGGETATDATAAAAPPQVAALPDDAAAVANDSPSADGTSFRWPVRGRIISDFGPKPTGERNDGINVSVPEGTSIKAAEAGRVIYAGNELASYGNLVLIEHAEGWVTAYAHASEILVNRGDSVQRGETIALAGSTGGVSSPQLHFELRRGSTPVNPLDYLSE